MPTLRDCPSCDKPIRLPAGSAGKKIRCGGCGAIHPIHEAEDGALMLQDHADGEPEQACPSCATLLSASTAFCTNCGAAMDGSEEASAHPAPAAAPPGRIAPGTHRAGGSRYAAKQRVKGIGLARKLILGFAVVSAVAGTMVMYFGRQAVEVEKRELLAEYAPSDVVVMEDGSRHTVSELLTKMDRNVQIKYLVHFGLAVLMAGLYFWARSSPFPAVLTGLCVYLSTIVMSVIREPSSITDGIFIRIVLITALLAGVQSALAERTAKRRALEHAAA